MTTVTEPGGVALPSYPRAPLVLSLEVLGFVLLGALVWAHEYFDIAHHVFGAPATIPRFSEIVIELSLVGIVGVAVTRASWLAFRRIAYLESFLVLCARCHRVKTKGQWTPLEQFMENRDGISTTHGICPQCFARVLEDAS